MPRCNYLQQSLAWCQGKPLYAGIRRRLYFIPRSDIVTWPELQRDEDSGVAVASYAFDSSFGLRADAVWHFIDILPEKSSLTSEPQGEFPNQTQLNKLVALHPGIGEEAAFAAAMLSENECIFAVEDMNGICRIVGADYYQTKTTVSMDHGQGITASAGTTITVETTDLCPAPRYQGILMVEEGDIHYGSPAEVITDEDDLL